MYKKTVITSWITGICLCLITVISALSQHHLSYQSLVSVLSYLGVYAISLYLAKHNGTEKIILTFVNILAVAMLTAMMINAVRKYSGLVTVSLLVICVVGTVTGIMAIWFNNRFAKVNSGKSKEH
ncbi:hypothetical protein [Secundilactobacillus silagei]|uniref:Uncharacterized protein n=1 Tax=Secundilactobacillus silagei JCM 19001 TaxID=1302250 RepID=A0A1Z5IK84_9LACO|nr:hypothetical protein [Secundilactobacillus silagei]TDG71219.1 hypothetical protein C5L25_001135 [Secundilactobacillus silagei JCM 19001]GAX01982.1 hypothetical protein IWT126_02046 [Secundilactobacillus silagei JCM 19001]